MITLRRILARALAWLREPLVQHLAHDDPRWGDPPARLPAEVARGTFEARSLT